MKATVGQITTYYLKSGAPRYKCVVEHTGLHKVQAFKGEDPNIVFQKASAKARQFDEQYGRKVEKERKKRERQQAAREKEQKKALAAKLTEQAESEWAELEQLLAATLAVDDAVDWETLKDFSQFSEPPPDPPAPVDQPLVPTIRNAPQREDSTYQDRPGIFTRLIDLFAPARKQQRLENLAAAFAEDYGAWEAEKASAEAAHEEALEQAAAAQDARDRAHQTAVRDWEARRDLFAENQASVNAAIDEDRRAYENHEPSAVEDYCDLVLERSSYPDFVPQVWELQYDPENKMLVVEYELPNIDSIPRLKQVKYVQSRDAFDEKEHSNAAVNRAYDSALYQIALRTIHELFEADRVVQALASVAFNGRVRRIDPATGHEVDSVILSLQVGREEFEAINLAAIDPKACFKSLKGVGSAKLHSLTPVAPIVRLERDDSRFVDSYEVASTLDQGENLASMDWEDFEHLVREVFELEFGQDGAEVKVTQASRDGGIDAVAFDPDPIRGGKIVIQAKRYTRTVGLSAVRDLYGTVVNEGANKGILVSTASYGPDAYAFARDKPLSLLSGGELLHLLQQHGFKVKIDLEEARANR